MQHKFGTGILALISMTLGVVAILLTGQSLRDAHKFLEASSPLFFPGLIACGLLLNGLAMAISTFKPSNSMPTVSNDVTGHTDARTWLGLLALLLYWASMPILGFWASSALVIAALATLFRAVSAVRVTVLAIIFPYIVIQIFWHAGHIILPQTTVFQ